jgi:zinc/manganese transport system permease protein
MLYDALLAPFVEYGFMRRALVAVIAVSVMAGPLGTFLHLRRMSLVGDALAHAVLPGVAVGFLLFGLDLWAMSLGGIAACLAVVFLAGLVARLTPQKEEASLAVFYLLSLALGVFIISLKGSPLDLLHILFGALLGVGRDGLILVVAGASLSVLVLAVIYRTLVVECFDPLFLRASGGRGALAHMAFLALVVINIVAAIQALGTLMAIGLMIVPAGAARFLARSVAGMLVLSSLLALVSGLAGLVASYHFDLPPGPTIVLAAGALYLCALVGGPQGGLVQRLFPRAHLRH